ncbi:hypothetical protein [Jiella avicenniae]|uniref:hypothetical protein n=1 Tax=Jiella avicenniae TaxID=2907202 RepID=UPI001F3D8777|nr:hypothetical protein [Jiella avicenniae]
MTVRNACLIGEQAAAQSRVICAEGWRKLAAMDERSDAGNGSPDGSVVHQQVSKFF